MRGFTLPDTLPEWLAVVEVLLVDHYSSAMASRAEVVEAWEEQVRWGTPARPDLELWGMTRDQERAALRRAHGR